jgi:hypothetical protein
MPENQQRDPLVSPKDEIELFDLLRILWKRKYIILAGTAAIVVIILAISLYMPKIYRSQMVLKPGLSHLDKKGNWVSVDSTSNMQFLIESEIIYKLENMLIESKDAEFEPPLIYKILADKSGNTITIACDSSHADKGVAELRLLLNALKEYYGHVLQSYLQEYESEIELVRHEIDISLKEQEFISTYLSEIQISLEKYEQKYTAITGNSIGEIARYLVDFTAIVDRTSRLKQTQSKNILRIGELKNKVRKLENEKKMLAPIRVIQPPRQVSGPNKSKIRLSLVSAPVIGFFVMVFLVLFIEYVRKVIAKIKQEKIFE